MDVNKSKGAIGSLIAVVILGLFLYWLAGKLGDLRDARLCRGVPEAMMPPKSGSALGRALSIDSYMPMQVGLSRSLVLSAVFCNALCAAFAARDFTRAVLALRAQVDVQPAGSGSTASAPSTDRSHGQPQEVQMSAVAP